MKKYKEIGVFNSVYSLFVFILLKGGHYEDTFFIFWKDIKSQISSHFHHIDNHDEFHGKNIYHSILLYSLYRIKFWYLYKKHMLRDLTVYGQDHIPVGRYLLEYTNNKFIVIEDGEANYITTYKRYDKKVIRKFLSLPYLEKFGHSNRVEEVVLTNREASVPQDIMEKVKWIDINKKWNELPVDKKEDILSIFNIPDLSNEQNLTILLTGPYDIEKSCTEEFKINFIRSIIEKYSFENYCIKPHYREITNYNDLFCSKILPSICPFELLLLLFGDRIKTIVTLSPNTTPLKYVRRNYPQIDTIVVDIYKQIEKTK